MNGDIAYGVAFYFNVDGAPFDLQVREHAIERLIQFCAEIKTSANWKYSVVHSEIPEIDHIFGTVIANLPRHLDSTQANCIIFADREVDRSPSGSGTAGRVAQLYLRGKLLAGSTLVNESVLRTIFKGRVLREAVVGDIPAVVPEIEGAAYMCGFTDSIVDHRDPLTNGFLMRSRR